MKPGFVVVTQLLNELLNAAADFADQAFGGFVPILKTVEPSFAARMFEWKSAKQLLLELGRSVVAGGLFVVQ